MSTTQQPVGPPPGYLPPPPGHRWVKMAIRVGAALRLADVAGPVDSDRLHALVAGAQGRCAALDGPGARDGIWICEAAGVRSGQRLLDVAAQQR